ncbi:hypothetical protein EX30DRAFT_339030 [Ascodesmis nigricans]|uniref:Thioesterase domain-containing protein n=1 Tax=Ascodesmis nigricans TaxID=341454 RepID=A0A4S2N0V0_9PEZI|nr:hypothetical protein EX30DRAFT_339030 [Ascodesmis nigricans]
MPTSPLLYTARRTVVSRRLPNPSALHRFSDQPTIPEDGTPVKTDKEILQPPTIRRCLVRRLRPLIRPVIAGRDVPAVEVQALEASGAPRVSRRRTGAIPFQDSINTDPNEPKIRSDMPRIRKEMTDYKGAPWVLAEGKLWPPFKMAGDVQKRAFSTSARRLNEDVRTESMVFDTVKVTNIPVPAPEPTDTDLELARSLLRLNAQMAPEPSEDGPRIRRVQVKKDDDEMEAPEIRRLGSSSHTNQDFRVRRYRSGEKKLPNVSHNGKPMSTNHDVLSQTLTPLSFVRDVWSSFLKHSGLEPTLLDGLRIISAEPGTVRFCLEVKQKHTNRMRNLHGGTIAAMVDLGGSLAVASRGFFATGVSTDLNVTYVGNGGQVSHTIFAEAKIDLLGNSLAFTRLEFFNAEGNLVARGSHTKQIRMARQHPLNRIEEMAKYAASDDIPPKTLAPTFWPSHAAQDPKLGIRRPNPPANTSASTDPTPFTPGGEQS